MPKRSCVDVRWHHRRNPSSVERSSPWPVTTSAPSACLSSHDLGAQRPDHGDAGSGQLSPQRPAAGGRRPHSRVQWPDGEWLATISVPRKRVCVMQLNEQTRPQPLPPNDGPDVHYLFAPLKRARLDYMVEKATEMGVVRVAARAHPAHPGRAREGRADARQRHRGRRAVRYSAPARRPRSHQIGEAARKAGTLLAASSFATRTRRRPTPSAPSRPCAAPTAARRRLAVLIGPGRRLLGRPSARCCSGLPFVTRLALGPRILRADTAAIAALSVVNAVLGDWR